MIFEDKIDWQAFWKVFQILQDKFSSEELRINKIQQVHNRNLEIQINLSPNFNKIDFESVFYQMYRDELEHLITEEEYLSDLETYQQQSLDFEEIIKRLAYQPHFTKSE